MPEHTPSRSSLWWPFSGCENTLGPGDVLYEGADIQTVVSTGGDSCSLVVQQQGADETPLTKTQKKKQHVGNTTGSV